jgi:magnesium-transporting ATPase (P-type)
MDSPDGVFGGWVGWLLILILGLVLAVLTLVLVFIGGFDSIIGTPEPWAGVVGAWRYMRRFDGKSQSLRNSVIFWLVVIVGGTLLAVASFLVR